MSELTDSLLTLARSDAVGLEMPLAEADLNSVVLETVQQVAVLAEGKGIRLEVHVLDKPALARANIAGMRRLLLILVDNGLKYAPHGGTFPSRSTKQIKAYRWP